MSGTFQPYTFCIRDMIALDNLYATSEGIFNGKSEWASETHQKAVAALVESYNYGIDCPPDPLEIAFKEYYGEPEKDAKTKFELSKDWCGYYMIPLRLVEHPEFLLKLREIDAARFKEVMGRDALPHRPVGPHEMHERNFACVEFSSTALFYVPALDEDVIMCVGEDNGWGMEHYRDKNTHEEIRQYHHDHMGKDMDGNPRPPLDNSKWHECLFEYDQDKRSEVGAAWYKKRKAEDTKKFKAAMEKLSSMSTVRYHPNFYKNIKGLEHLANKEYSEKDIQLQIEEVTHQYYKIQHDLT